MKKNIFFSRIIIAVVYIALSVGGGLFAQDAPTTPPAAKRNLGPWWQQSSMVPDPMPERFLFHTEIEYSFTGHSGNLKGNEQEGNFLFVSRKGRFTVYVMSNTSLTKLDIYPSGQKVNLYAYYAENIFRFDLTKRFYTDLGFFWERDNNKLLDKRTTYYLGLGYFYRIPGKIDASLFLGGGSQSNDYLDAVPIPAETETAAYIVQTFTWYISPQVMFKEKYRSIRFTEDTDRFEDNFYLSLGYALGPIVQVMYEYEWNFNNAPWPNKLKKDVKQMVGLRLGF